MAKLPTSSNVGAYSMKGQKTSVATSKTSTTPNAQNQPSGLFSPNNDPDYDPLDTFKKFKPRSEKHKLSKTVMNELNDFAYNPKKFFCQKHKDTEIEYCCKINETFYCRLCAHNHKGHDDLVLADVCQ